MSLHENDQPRLEASLSLHLVENSTSELVSSSVTAHVACPGLALGNDIVDSL